MADLGSIIPGPLRALLRVLARTGLCRKVTPAVYPVVESPYLEDDPHSSSSASSFVASCTPDPKETPTL